MAQTKQPLNFVFLNCHQTYWFHLFAVKLKEQGVRVVGTGTIPIDYLPPPLKGALTDYQVVSSMQDYDSNHKACQYFVEKYGKIDYIESFTQDEVVLMQGKLRDAFGVTTGPSGPVIGSMICKSDSKKIWAAAGIKVSPGIVPANLEEAVSFANKHGYPFISKPDFGSGSVGVMKLNNEDDLRAHFQPGYLLEKFIVGRIETFDGLVDKAGEVVFSSSMHYGSGGIRELLAGESVNTFYYADVEVKQDMKEVGVKAVKALGLKCQFFHCEIYRTHDNDLLPIEMNFRPSGGMNVSFWGWQNGRSLYEDYAKIVTDQPISPYPAKANVYAGYAGRFNHLQYKYTIDEVKEKIGANMKMTFPMPASLDPNVLKVFGNHAFSFIAPDISTLLQYDSFVRDTVA